MNRLSQSRLPPLDEEPGPAKRISQKQASHLVEQAMAAYTKRARAWWPRVAALAASLVLVLGGATFAQRLIHRGQSPAATALVSPGGSAIPARRNVGEAATVTTETQSPPESRPAEIMARPEPAVSDRPDVPRGFASQLRHKRSGFVRSPAPRIDLLRTANGLRGQARWRDAERLYRQVATAAPTSEEGYAANVAAAALRLEHLRDPAGALRLYRGALRSHPEGSLAEEVRWGMADAYRAMGNAISEETALREFIAAHPRSLMRAKAEGRLAAPVPATHEDPSR